MWGWLAALLATSMASGAAAAPSVAFVDVQKILVKSRAGAAAREQLEREKATMQKEITTRNAEVEQLREELEKKGMLLAPDVKREKEETLQRRIRDLRRLVDDLQKELERKEKGLTQQLLQDLSLLIERVGKERGYLMIIEKRGASVIYGAAEVDLTEEIIKVFDLERGKETKK
jgi:outer membrane protein